MMEHILVINSGSSSLKAKLFEVDGMHQVEVFERVKLFRSSSYRKAMEELVKTFNSYRESIKFISHRIVMGGEGAKNGELADEDVINRIKRVSNLAPLHNPRALNSLKICQSAFPKILNAVVYDTAFYASLPEEEYTFPIDKNIVKRYSLRKYGFHGISHQYAYQKTPNKYDRMVTIHLGAGCSITAIHHGKPIATSMGMTPLGGLVMQTRSGDIDPGVILYLGGRLGLAKTKKILELNSGLKGISGTSGEMLDILALTGNPVEVEHKYAGPNNQYLRHQASISLEIYSMKARDYIGSYAARMGGLEAIVFTGEIGFGSKFIRDKITYGLDYLNLREVAAIEPNEELAMAEIIYNQYFKGRT